MPEASLQLCCPRCEAMSVYRATDLAASESPRCPGCSLELSGQAKAPRPDAPIERCWLCGNDEFYIQKDFNRRLGFIIVITSALVIFLVMLLTSHLVGLFLLVGVALLDWVVYQVLANVTVCYLCQSLYRGFPLNPAHSGFYLGNEEKYKKLRQDWLDTVQGGH